MKYRLHPTYGKRQTATLTETPFLLSYTAYGFFSIRVTITFQSWTKMAPFKLAHLLSFSPNGKIFSHFIETDVPDNTKGPSTTPSEMEFKTLAQISKAL